MTAYSAILIIGSGYLSGLSIASGLLLSILRKDLADRESKFWLKSWPILAVGNWILAIFGISLVFALAVAHKDDYIFIVNAVLFVIGLILGASLVLYVFHCIDRRYKLWSEHDMQGNG